MTPLEQKLDALLADPLQAARADGRAIGHVGGDVPVDLLLATRRVVAHLPWNVGQPTPRADCWLESSFPGWARSMLEDWAAGRFDCFAQVIFSRGNDVAQRLYYYVCELQRGGQLSGPEPLVFDIAYIPRDASLRHTEAALRRLAARLGVDAALLATGIAQANRLRETFQQIESGRIADGVLHEKLVRASLFTDVARLVATCAVPDASPARCRVLLAGSAPPDGRLHEAVDATGAAVIAELHELASARLGPVIDAASGDPFAAIARQRRAAPIGPRSFGDAATRLVEAVRHVRAQAVLLWLTEEDEALAWHLPAQREALDRAGIPLLAMTARRWDASDGAAAEIDSFLKGVVR